MFCGLKPVCGTAIRRDFLPSFRAWELNPPVLMTDMVHNNHLATQSSVPIGLLCHILTRDVKAVSQFARVLLPQSLPGEFPLVSAHLPTNSRLYQDPIGSRTTLRHRWAADFRISIEAAFFNEANWIPQHPLS